MKRFPAFVLFALFCLSVVGCVRTLPVYNVSSKPVVTGSGAQLSADKVREAIIEAAQFKRWTVKPKEDGQLLATINVRRHMAEITIDYSPTEYSIRYNNSNDLLYDGTKIHRNYNKWVKLLEAQISATLNRR